MSDTHRRVARLRTIAGHLRGIQRMEREGAYCIDIIKQTQAVQAALDKFAGLVLEQHLTTCVTDTIRSADEHERERVVTELVQVYAPLIDGAEPGEQFVLPRLDYLRKVERDVQQIEQLVTSDALHRRYPASTAGQSGVGAVQHPYSVRPPQRLCNGCDSRGEGNQARTQAS